jgi:hypothetical protein
MPRRRFVVGGLCGVFLPMRWAVATSSEPAPLHTEEVAPGIHVLRGVDEDASASNDDAIANIGFIVGRDSVAVFDPGGCLADGRRLRARIRQVTALPIRYVVMSHDRMPQPALCWRAICYSSNEFRLWRAA